MKKSIKTLISVMLVFCVLMAFASCGDKDSDTSSKKSVTKAEAAEPVIITTPTDDTSSNDESQVTKTLALANPNTVLLDSNGVKLTALDFSDEESDTFVIIDVHVENSNTHDVNIMLNSMTINGYMISGKIDSFTTKAGADQIVTFTISKRDLEFAEIDEIREILVSFYVKDADFDMFISPTEPVSLKTTKFNTPAPELNTDGVQIYNSNNILIVAKEELSSDNRYMLAKLIIKNDSDSVISVSCDRLLVNGKELKNHNCIRNGRVPAGIISYNSMDIEKSELADLGIEEVETIEMTLKVLSSEYTIIADNLTVTVNCK